MEKYVVFGPIIIFFGFFLLIIVGFLLLVGKLFSKAKKQAWIGEVIDKTHNVKDKDEGPGKEHFYFFRIRFENGEEHNIATSAKMFDEVQIGDKLKKEEGSLWPKKIS